MRNLSVTVTYRQSQTSPHNSMLDTSNIEAFADDKCNSNEKANKKAENTMTSNFLSLKDWPDHCHLSYIILNKCEDATLSLLVKIAKKPFLTHSQTSPGFYVSAV